MVSVAADGGVCPFCFDRTGGSLRADVKGRPYFTCMGCHTRAFIHNPKVVKIFQWFMSSGVNYGSIMTAVQQAQPQPTSEVRS